MFFPLNNFLVTAFKRSEDGDDEVVAASGDDADDDPNEQCHDRATCFRVAPALLLKKYFQNELAILQKMTTLKVGQHVHMVPSVEVLLC